MIKYTMNNNTVIAEFSRDWIDTLAEYYFKNTYINYDTLRDVVYDYLLKVESDGLRPYGEAKCHPDDKFDLGYGKKLARKRLVTKYNRMRYLFFKKLDKYMASCRSITSAKRDKYFLASEGDYHA